MGIGTITLFMFVAPNLPKWKETTITLPTSMMLIKDVLQTTSTTTIVEEDHSLYKSWVALIHSSLVHGVSRLFRLHITNKARLWEVARIW
jgi:hypothetical protein